MNLYKLIIGMMIFVLNFPFIQIQAQHKNRTDNNVEYLPIPEIFPNDSLVAESPEKPVKTYKYILLKPSGPTDTTIFFVDSITRKHRLDSIMSIPLSKTDSLLYASNSLLLPLVYTGKDIRAVWDINKNLMSLANGSRNGLITNKLPVKMTTENFVADLRRGARDYISNHAMQLYVTTLDRLPSLSTFMSRPIKGSRVNPLAVYEDKIDLGNKKIEINDLKYIYWTKKANALLQFSQNYVSSNWYQGGNSNFAFLSIITGETNYDNRKNIQWDNRFEWRTGLSSIIGNTKRKVMINDDILRYNTKFGLKAGGNWFYSVSGELSTQLFDSYKSINSDEYKGRLFTPVRANLGVGMDYKYKKYFSLMIAPVAFKYIYVHDTIHVNQNLFGVKKGENQLKQIGSSFRAQLNIVPARNWNLDSKLSFYTDYKKVEIDWEIVNNFIINRFLTTRISLNPRFDNTIILKEGEKTKIQFKELMSIGFSYRFL